MTGLLPGQMSSLQQGYIYLAVISNQNNTDFFFQIEKFSNQSLKFQIAKKNYKISVQFKHTIDQTLNLILKNKNYKYWGVYNIT